MNTTSTTRDESGILRTGGGQFATELKTESDASLARKISTSDRLEELQFEAAEAKQRLQEANQASIDAHAAGLGSDSSERYGDSVRLSMVYVRAQLDMSRAQWDLD